MSKPILQLKAPEFIPLSEVRSLIGQPLKVEIPQGAVTKEGIELILLYLKEAYQGVELPSHRSSKAFQWTWLDPKHGTLPKRMAKWLKKRLKANPDQKVIAHVGNLARQNSDDNQEYYFRIVDKIDWSANQFGKDGGGCWWGVRGSNQAYGKAQEDSYADRFIKNDGLGVQFFKSENYSYNNGIGRLWVYIESTFRFATTFNGYWENEGATLRLTRVLATYLGLGYKQCMYLSTNFSVYINDDKGYFIGDEQALNFLHKDATYKIPKKVVYKPCTRCSTPTDETAIYDSMCRTCYDATRKICPSCYTEKDSTRFAQVRTNDGLIEWCANCVSTYARSCTGCKNAWIARYFDYPGCVKVDGLYMCTKCTMSSRKCQDCGKRTVNVDAMDDPLCLRCEDAFEQEIRIDHLGEVTFNITAATSEAMRFAVSESNAAMNRLRRQLEARRAEVLSMEPIDDEYQVPF